MRLSRSERMLGGIPGRLCWKSWNRRGPGSMSRTSKRVQRSPTSSSDFATGQAWPYRLGTSRVYRRLDRKASHYKIASHMDPATRRLLDGPIAPTLLRLAAPNVIMLVTQVAISVLEAYYVGWLGADALAGVSVTFPLVMLMQTMSAGGMGGGVASAVARALGAGRRADASRLVTHAIVIALVMAGLFTVVVLGGGGAIYHAMGARDGALAAALAVVAYYVAGTLVLFVYLASGRSLIRLSPTLRFERSLFAAILRVGAPSLVNNVMTNLTVVLLTALVGPFGTFALAGYGMGVRLEYLLIPLVFGFGSALVTMVGTNFGAGQRTRARRVAWTGALIAAGTTEAIGLAAALFPHAWLGLFSNEPEVLAAGAAYLRVVGPAYGFFGLGLALYFASQGAGRLLWPLLAG